MISSPAKSLLQCVLFGYKHNEKITSFFTEKSLPWTTHGKWYKWLSSSECVWASRALDLAGGDQGGKSAACQHGAPPSNGHIFDVAPCLPLTASLSCDPGVMLAMLAIFCCYTFSIQRILELRKCQVQTKVKESNVAPNAGPLRLPSLFLH